MSDLTFETLFEQVQRLSHVERLRMMELLAVTLQADLTRPTDWNAALRATYGILADDPMDLID